MIIKVIVDFTIILFYNISKLLHSLRRCNPNGIIDENWNIRKFTPIECERLQTLPDNYTEGLTDRQRYEVIGNGWTIDVISHIFSFIPQE